MTIHTITIREQEAFSSLIFFNLTRGTLCVRQLATGSHKLLATKTATNGC